MGRPQSMPVLRLIRERFKKEKPLAGVRISRLSSCDDGDGQTCMDTLKAGGADVVL
ncbi:MAG: hypothetical protein MPW15_06955 [Candidatus Manganitrophus sp.]|nr:hypothetical protein [Candidatus Manganitrophus sp.]